MRLAKRISILLLLASQMAAIPHAFGSEREDMHWSTSEPQEPDALIDDRKALQEYIENYLEFEDHWERNRDLPIPMSEWKRLLQRLFPNQPGENIDRYTSGLSDEPNVRRDLAVVGITKLWSFRTHDATDAEKELAGKAFADLSDAYDQSKLTIAYLEGIIYGYPNGTFEPEKELTFAEALVLVKRAAAKEQ